MVRNRVMLLVMLGFLIFAGKAAGGDDWRTDFDDACAKTTEAMDLSREELLNLIAKCERVKKALETQDEAVRKVYLKRVQMCLSLFQYVVDTKVQDAAKPPPAK